MLPGAAIYGYSSEKGDPEYPVFLDSHFRGKDGCDMR